MDAAVVSKNETSWDSAAERLEAVSSPAASNAPSPRTRPPPPHTAVCAVYADRGPPCAHAALSGHEERTRLERRARRGREGRERRYTVYVGYM